MRVSAWHDKEITEEIEKRAMDRLEKAGKIIAAEAKRRVPVKSGKLRQSIRVRRLKGDPKQDVRVYAGNRIKGGAFYAHMVERGTKKMTARPFLRPALYGSRNMILTLMRNG